MRLLRALALASILGAWAVIVIGGYVSATGSGLGCPGLLLCGNADDPVAAAIESSHRVAAWIEGLLVLTMFILVWWRYRGWRSVRSLTTYAFVLVAAQSVLGIVTVATALHPVVVTAHLGVATAFLAVTVLNAFAVWQGPPTASLPSVAVGSEAG